MKKRHPLPTWPEAMIPVLPLLPVLVSLPEGILTAAAGTVFYLLLAVLFQPFKAFWNSRWFALLYLTAAAALIYASQLLISIPVNLIFTLALLDLGGKFKRKKAFKPIGILISGGVFLALALYLCVAQEILGGWFALSLFQRVSGSFLLLWGLALFWPTPRKKRGLKLTGNNFYKAIAS